MKNSLRLHKLAACIGVAAVLAGCASIEGKGGDTAMGSGIGAAIGAGLGVLIGDSTEGALIGAGIGAVAGGIVGYNWSAIKNDVEKSGASDLGVAVTEMPDGTLRVHIPSNVSFDSGQYQLKPALLPVLDSVARALIQHPELRAKAIGYTDNTGSLQLNQTLSLERAQAVTGYMANQGVPASHMTDEGRGPNNPIASNDTQEGRSLNRRVELFLYAVKQP